MQNPPDPTPTRTSSVSHGKSRRRVVDTAGLAFFHAAIVGLFAWGSRDAVFVWTMLAIPVVAMDFVYLWKPEKHRVKLEPIPDPEAPSELAQMKPFALELSVLLGPPLILICWFMYLIWVHQILSQYQLAAVLVAIPVVVGLVAWIMKVRMTRHHAGVKNSATKFIGLSTLLLWIGAVFLFVILLGAFLVRLGLF